MKHILMLATGGTIACRQTGHGLAPALTGEELLEFLPKLSDICKTTVVNPMSIDSTDITAEHRAKLAKLVWEQYANYDGFVITHGTDTLAFTAAQLYHMLPNFAKPLIITGAQNPIGDAQSDAEGNLLGAFRVASSNYVGVAAFLHGQIIRGNRIVKVDSQATAAFRSINAPADGAVNVTGKVIINNNQQPQGEPTLLEEIDPNIMLLRLTPDLDPSILDFLARYHKVIIECFGSGGVPTRLEKVLQKLIMSGTKVYLTTQCLHGGIDLHKYQVGRRAEAMGAVSLGDRTTEDALAALMCGEL